jgi:hypothetical protein
MTTERIARWFALNEMSMHDLRALRAQRMREQNSHQVIGGPVTKQEFANSILEMEYGTGPDA